MLSSSHNFSRGDHVPRKVSGQYRTTKVAVSYDALAKNLNTIRELVSPAMVAVVVKGNAYGHGMSVISDKLEELDADMLCVATAESALTLRRRGVSTPILMLSEMPNDALSACYQNDITFAVYTSEMIDVIATLASEERPAHIHLKVNTGMNRVGCKSSDALMLARHIAKHDSLFFEGIFTHFACADDPNQGHAEGQLKEFEKVLDDIQADGLIPPIVHAANSAAAISMPSTRFSMVRSGIAVYGIHPDPRMAEMIDLEQVLSFTTNISFLKTISEGESASYGARFTAEKETRVATLHAGYSDGIPRNLGLNGGTVLIHGVRCPIIGVVTMDMMMIDVGDLAVSVGDRVTLLGTDGPDTISPTEWAELTGTIPWEILCRLGERLPRKYY